jgi:hypothetical protein
MVEVDGCWDLPLVVPEMRKVSCAIVTTVDWVYYMCLNASDETMCICEQEELDLSSMSCMYSCIAICLSQYHNIYVQTITIRMPLLMLRKSSILEQLNTGIRDKRCTLVYTRASKTFV